MRPRNAAILACRILAIFFATESVVAIVGFLVATRGSAGVGSFWAFELTQLFIAVLLWAAAEGLGEMMTRGTSDEAPGSPRPLAQTLSGAFSVVGLVLAAQAIPALVGIATATSTFASAFSGASIFGFNRGATILASVVKLVIGGLIIYFAKPLGDAVALRAEGTPAAPPRSPSEGS